ncbi:MAG: hypothetical protein IT379_41050 [Deltaproteobacteria bacterium]|nr:hypothetical protein [Deltaproteobacteria bacterium]
MDKRLRVSVVERLRKLGTSTIAAALVPAFVATMLPQTSNAQPAPPPSYGGSVQVTAQPAPYPQYGGGYPQPGGYGAYPMPRREVPYDEGMAVPPGAVVIERTRRAMWITGLTLFFSFYGISVLVAASVTESEVTPLWIPVVGPWMMWANLDDDDAGGRFLLALDGLGQVAGALLFVLGLTVTRRYIVYGAENERQRDSRRFAVLPFIRPDAAGVSLTMF